MLLVLCDLYLVFLCFGLNTCQSCKCKTERINPNIYVNICLSNTICCLVSEFEIYNPMFCLNFCIYDN